MFAADQNADSIPGFQMRSMINIFDDYDPISSLHLLLES
jgi:hypothetical protein